MRPPIIITCDAVTLYTAAIQAVDLHRTVSCEPSLLAEVLLPVSPYTERSLGLYAWHWETNHRYCTAWSRIDSLHSSHDGGISARRRRCGESVVGSAPMVAADHPPHNRSIYCTTGLYTGSNLAPFPLCESFTVVWKGAPKTPDC